MDDESTRSKSAVVIRLLREEDSLEALTGLLHRAYKALADIGLRFLATWQDVEITRQRIAEGTCFVAVIDDAIIGTITFKMPHAGHGVPWLARPDVGNISQLAVEPAFQNQGIGGRLMRHAEEYAQGRGLAELASDTSEQARHLIAWYERLGYRGVDFVQWEIVNYRSVVMSKSVTTG
ncbi:MAG: GNAT family N-acetyltransferase [candidate division Zixibacteria bacterium]|nr:GNAT family N-acetyltransferase [candidate division Zixibacteria bacterium]